MSYRHVHVAVLITVLAGGIGAEQERETPSIGVTTALVQVDVVVTDKKGNHVGDLQPRDFEILEGGRVREITHFTHVVTGAQRGEAIRKPEAVVPQPVAEAPAVPNRAPRTIAIVLDDLNLSSQSMRRAKDRLRDFLGEKVQVGDRLALLRTGAGLTALQGFTADHRKLRSTVDRLRWNPLSGRVQSTEPVDEGASTQLLTQHPEIRVKTGEEADSSRRELLARASLASIKAIAEALRRVPGRKALALVSDGLRLSAEQGIGRLSEAASGLTGVIEAANEGSVVVYGLDARGVESTSFTAMDDFTRSQNDPGGRPQPTFGREGKKALDERQSRIHIEQETIRALSADTGGFFIRGSDLAGSLDRVYGDQAGYYLLGFVPDETESSRRFRRIEVKVKRAGLVVRARDRYWDGPTRLSPPPDTTLEQFVAAFQDPFDSNDVSLRMMPLVGRDPDGSFFVRALVHVDGSALTFEQKGEGHYEARIDVVGVARRDDGLAEGESDTVHTIRAQGQEGVERLRERGVVVIATMTLAKPGFHQIRVAVRDTPTQRLGWASEMVEVPNLKKSKVALSGLVLGDEGTDPVLSGALRRFRPGGELRASFIVFGGKAESARKTPAPVVEWQLAREGAESAAKGIVPFVVSTYEGAVKGLPAEARIPLPPDLVPGDYALAISVKGLEKKPLPQWADLTVEQVPGLDPAPPAR
jgi:VWFA-related protein